MNLPFADRHGTRAADSPKTNQPPQLTAWCHHVIVKNLRFPLDAKPPSVRYSGCRVFEQRSPPACPSGFSLTILSGQVGKRGEIFCVQPQIEAEIMPSNAVAQMPTFAR